VDLTSNSLAQFSSKIEPGQPGVISQ